MQVDLHTHTRCSDGSLTPGELIDRAIDAGVDILSITDHDTINAYDDDTINLNSTIRLVPGIEFSAQWRGQGVHILGLNIELDGAEIQSGIASQRDARIERSKLIAERLEKSGIKGSLQVAQKNAGHELVARTHFAHALVELGVVNNFKLAFKKYLGAGKAGDVQTDWAALQEIVGWIQSASGVAVLAHPAKYKLTKTKLKSLVVEFKEAGGQGLEVISGKQSPDVTQYMAKLCEQYEMLASAGSDFHKPGQSWSEVGSVSALPKSCKPVWENW